jgi:phage terminase large subunit-like protein
VRERDGARLVRFCELVGRVTRGSGAGRPIRLQPWQRDLLTDTAASGARRAYWQLPRKNGKSTLGSLVALHALCADGEEGAEVYSVAGSREQARIVFGEARRMVELGPLSRRLRLYRNEIVHAGSGSRYRALAAEAGMQEGLNPHLVVFDELHVLGSARALYDVMNLGMGARECPLMLAITTPGVRYGRDGRDSLAWLLYDHARRVASGELDDPGWFSRVWEAPADADLSDEAAWHAANPALGTFLSLDDMRDAVRATPENEFRTKRMGQWTVSHEAWLPAGAWEACGTGLLDSPLPPDPGTRIVLGFDGSKSRDSTALIGATVEPAPRVFVVAVWERPELANLQWQVPRLEVAAKVAEAVDRWDVVELAADSALWLSELQAWEADGVPVVSYPQTPSRMVPATQRFYEAAVTGELRHDGDPILARHVGNAVIRPNGQVGKEHKDSRRKVDAAVAAIMAHDRAAVLAATRQRAPVKVWSA